MNVLDLKIDFPTTTFREYEESTGGSNSLEILKEKMNITGRCYGVSASQGKQHQGKNRAEVPEQLRGSSMKVLKPGGECEMVCGDRVPENEQPEDAGRAGVRGIGSRKEKAREEEGAGGLPIGKRSSNKTQNSPRACSERRPKPKKIVRRRELWAPPTSQRVKVLDQERKKRDGPRPPQGVKPALKRTLRFKNPGHSAKPLTGRLHQTCHPR
uniref:Predicted protein n=1 Tax=Physcomitrium patens TaxID=3218 RepID=A9U1C0_PHYPA